MMDEVYDQFTKKAADGRHMAVDELKKHAGGRIWTGRQAQQIGLVDEVGTLHDAIRTSIRLAGKDPDQKPELLILPEPKSLFDQLFNSSSVSLPRLHAQTIEAELLHQARSLQQLFAEPALLLMPYRIEIR
jgi:protease-4